MVKGINLALLRKIRKQKNLTLAEVASKTGYSIARISEIERSENAPLVTIESICEALDISFLYLSNLSCANEFNTADVNSDNNNFAKLGYNRIASNQLFDVLKLVKNWKRADIEELLQYIRIREFNIRKTRNKD